jgi:DNA-binding transcriptional LysR family regulator
MNIQHPAEARVSPSDVTWWHKIEISDLRCFIALSEEMHFGRAACRLHMAQPALSRKIARLEADFGGRLFDRTRAQIKITAAGVMLLHRAQDVLQRLGDMAEDTRRVALGKQGLLEIGFVSSATFSVLPDLIGEYHRYHPLVELRFHHMNRAGLFHALVNRRVHVVFTRAGIDDAEIVNVSLLRERMVVALPADNPLAHVSSLALTDLAQQPFILPKVSVDDHVRNICAKAGFHPIVVQEPEDLHTSLSLVAAGLGLALVPDSARNAPRSGVVYRTISEPALFTDFMLSYRRDNTDTLLQTFRTFVKQKAALKAKRTETEKAA